MAGFTPVPLRGYPTRPGAEKKQLIWNLLGRVGLASPDGIRPREASGPRRGTGGRSATNLQKRPEVRSYRQDHLPFTPGPEAPGEIQADHVPAEAQPGAGRE